MAAHGPPQSENFVFCSIFSDLQRLAIPALQNKPVPALTRPHPPSRPALEGRVQEIAD
jgi:hypothetical protein